ncbi:Flp pilus assembly protein CpaB [Myceligenerans xiligouense]|uniref:Pilus assembly protein CpaB n=1 Tax=Myceligenerans xiligouense TaxID=253184 RepID=A0A3N4ZPN7_9MICO|nr:Flp pilus assembly protein CpaB [Myceligenerans xiligouense]RPF22935.1 pilus assembly protein CpaB [Myceligenerans xiligouense]
MNPRQRRGVFLLVVTSVLAVAVFAGVLYYVRTVSTQVGPMTTVLQLNRAVEAQEPIEPAMLEEVEVPERWAPESALHDKDEVEGLVAATAYQRGAMVQSGMLVERPIVEPGFREVAVIVDAETGVAGKVRPGDRVDVIATMKADGGSKNLARVWVSNVLVVEVGIPTTVEEPDDIAPSRGLPVTFALSTEDALTLAYIETFSEKMRIALRGAGDEEEIPFEERTFNGTLPQKKQEG